LVQRDGWTPFPQEAEKGLEAIVIQVVADEVKSGSTTPAAPIQIVEVGIGTGPHQRLGASQVGGGSHDDDTVDGVAKAMGRLEDGEQIAGRSTAVVAIHQTSRAIDPLPVGDTRLARL
jgi:hypothetical protein